MIKRSITFMTLALALTTLCQAQSRKVINLPSWDFSRDGKAWQQVAVPHDWAISGPFDKKWDLQMALLKTIKQQHLPLSQTAARTKL